MYKIEFTGTLSAPAMVTANEMQRIADMMLQEVQKNFRTSGRGAWPPRKAGGRATLGYPSGGIYKTLGHKSGDDWAEVFGGGRIKYGWIHQLGGITHPHVTRRSKRFFWAMWYKTGDEMWKWMALKSIGSTMTIPIPSRPWMVLPEDFEKKVVDFLGEVIIEQKSNIPVS